MTALIYLWLTVITISVGCLFYMIAKVKAANIETYKRMNSTRNIVTRDHSLPTGTYAATTSGRVSVFECNEKLYRLLCENYVKGVDIPDVVIVCDDGCIKSRLLGKGVL